MGTWRWPLRQHQRDQMQRPARRCHAWEASRTWSWRWDRCGGTSSGLLTTSSWGRTSSGCSAWASKWPTSAGTSTSRATCRERAPTWSGRNSSARRFRRFTTAAWWERWRGPERRRPRARGGRRLPPGKVRQCPAAHPAPGTSTWKWPHEGATGSSGRINADNLQSQISSKWRRRSTCIAKCLPDSRKAQRDPVEDHEVVDANLHTSERSFVYM